MIGGNHFKPFIISQDSTLAEKLWLPLTTRSNALKTLSTLKGMSMIPKRERILYVLVFSLKEGKEEGGGLTEGTGIW